MIKNIKRTLISPIIFGMSVVVWTLWSMQLSAERVIKSIEHLVDKLFNWSEM